MRVVRSYLLALALVVGGSLTAVLSTPVAPAVAAALPDPVRADLMPTPQINGVVWKQRIVGNTVFVGGEFTTARPFGAAPGVNTAPRANMLAYNLTTGALDTSFAPTFNAKINDMAVTPDGTKLVVVGPFTQVNGLDRHRVAVFDLPSKTLSNTVVPDVNGQVSAVAASNTQIWIGGYFSAIGSTSRTQVAALNPTNGAVLPVTLPTPDGTQVKALALNPSGTRVILGGDFGTVGGVWNPAAGGGRGLFLADTASGVGQPLPLNATVWGYGAGAGVLSVAADSTSFYATLWNYNGTGTSEGYVQGSWSDGSMVNLEDCHGDTYDVAPIGDIVYVSSHAHQCLNTGSVVPQSSPTSSWTHWHSTAWTKSTQGTNTKNTYSGYGDHAGTSRPGVLPFFPQWGIGSYTGQDQATWTVTGNDSNVLYGGEFTSVDGIAQQGLSRFVKRSTAPNATGPLTQSSGPFTISAVSLAAGRVRVSWPALWDHDDLTLSYRLLRNGAQVYATSLDNYQWGGQQLTYTDTVAAGSTPSYVVQVRDGDGNLASSSAATTTVASADPLDAYSKQVLKDGATKFWRLDDTGSTVADLAGPDRATAGSGVTRGTAGAMTNSSDAASSFNGTSNGVILSPNLTMAPNTFSTEVWFKTTSTAGGKILGFGDAVSGSSSKVDRHLYMTNQSTTNGVTTPAGIVKFGVAPEGQGKAISSPTPLNDGNWHQAVATLGSAGMKLYIDGALAQQWADWTAGENYGGRWRVGGDTTWSGGGNPYFNGAIDDFSLYPTALTAAQVHNHWAASAAGERGVVTEDAIPTPPSTGKPSATTTASARGRRVALRGSATSPNGAITATSWSFGDGAKASGASVSHTFARPGTYTVSFTARDSTNATTTVTRRLTVANARPIASYVVGVRRRVVSFYGTRSTDADGRVVRYSWSFGDGKVASGAVVRHKFKKARHKYTVRLTVTDDSGASTYVTKRIKTGRR